MPKVHLHATHKRALDVVGYEELKKHASEIEVWNASNVAQSTQGRMEGTIKERTELARRGTNTNREL